MLIQILLSEPLLFFALLLAIVIALTVHEYSHAAVARLLGDRTAEQMGRLTLNPLAHLDLIGFFMLLVAGFGYAKPVPYNPFALKHQRRDPLLIGFAGPVSNLVMAVIFAFFLKAFIAPLGPNNLLIQFLYLASLININLAIFNLLPIPPLDGSNILPFLLRGRQWAKMLEFIFRQGPIILLALILVDAFGGVGIFSGLFGFFGHLFFTLMGIRF